MGQFNGTVSVRHAYIVYVIGQYAPSRVRLNGLFSLLDLKKEPYISQISLNLWWSGNRTSCRPIQSVIILVIKQIGLPLGGPPILLITRMITDRIGRHEVLLPLLIDKVSLTL